MRPSKTKHSLHNMIESLCAWFELAQRDLPWRRRRSGYTALVAETMLQQTQVSRVIQRFQQFMRAFPSVKALAAADEQHVLTLWQGLGYYRRARNLHTAARIIVRDFGGRVPQSREDLMRLPGVGRYTAGAIASIVFGRAEPIVDGNVGRVLARVFADDASLAQPQALTEAEQRALAWKTAEGLVRRAKRPGVLNEALMELGARVCLPSPAKPRCDACPIAHWCAAWSLGLQNQVPPVRPRAKPRLVDHHAVIVTRTRSNLILFEQRGRAGMWQGLWQTPTIESAREMDATAITASLRVAVSRLRKRGEFTHRTTHRVIRFHVYAAISRARRGTWRRLDNLCDLPMSNAQQRVLEFARCHPKQRDGHG